MIACYSHHLALQDMQEHVILCRYVRVSVAIMVNAQLPILVNAGGGELTASVRLTVDVKVMEHAILTALVFATKDFCSTLCQRSANSHVWVGRITNAMGLICWAVHKGDKWTCKNGICECWPGFGGSSCNVEVEPTYKNQFLGINLAGLSYWSTQHLFKDY